MSHGEPPVVLIITPYYLPGWKAGGPIRSLANLVAHLGHEFRFKVIAPVRDTHDPTPYPGIEPGIWQKVGHADVVYMDKPQLEWRNLARLINAIKPDVIYLNSIFSPNYSLKPLILRYLGLIPKVPFVVASRGELAPAARAITPWRKRIVLACARAVDLHRGLTWNATSAAEAEDITGLFGSVRIVRTKAPAEELPAVTRTERKEPGHLRAIFLARINRMKNLDLALQLLATVPGRVEFDLYGPVEDETYWRQCQIIIRSLPNTIQVTHRGPVDHHAVREVLPRYDLFFMPTAGENFGHAIYEALACGVPVLISDRTPWRNLEERRAGWDLPLERLELFRDALQRTVLMPESEHEALRRGARAFLEDTYALEDAVATNRQLLREAK